MKKTMTTLAAFLLASTAFAGSPDFTAFNLDDATPPAPAPAPAPGHPHGGKLHQCMRQAWKMSSPTQDQNKAAHDFVAAVRAVMTQHKDGLHQGMTALKAAWKKYPIAKDEVVAAEASFHEHMMPVKEAVRDAHIGILNLLTAEQRGTFDAAFTSCMHGH